MYGKKQPGLHWLLLYETIEDKLRRMLLKTLLLEDNDKDAMLLLGELESAGFQLDYERVYTRQGMLSAINQRMDWDIILADHNLPGFSSTDALLLLLQRNIDIPLIIISGSIGEEVAVEAMKAGAQDVVMKGHLSRLGPAVSNALDSTRAKRESRDYQQRLRELSVHLETVREEERAMIAREIHDEFGGLLTVLKMDTRWLERQFVGNSEQADEKFSAMVNHIDNAAKAMRRIISDLRPGVLDDLGLIPALEWQLGDFCKRYEMACHFRCTHEDVRLENKNREIAVFRIFQESLTNIARHARAGRVNVELRYSPELLELEITDDGVGIAEVNKLKKGSFGILGMNERAASLGGKLEVLANKGSGTTVLLRLPLSKS